MYTTINNITTLGIISLFSYIVVCLLIKNINQDSNHIILLAIIPIIIYILSENKVKLSNKNILGFIFVIIVYILILMNNKFGDDSIEGFRNGDKIKELKDKSLLSEKFKGKLQKYTGRKVKKERFASDSDGVYRTENMGNDLYGYYESFNNTSLKNRSGSVYESLTKLYVLKDKLFEIF